MDLAPKRCVHSFRPARRLDQSIPLTPRWVVKLRRRRLVALQISIRAQAFDTTGRGSSRKISRDPTRQGASQLLNASH